MGSTRLLLLCSLAAAPVRAQPEDAWGSQQTQHFLIRHQRHAMSLGDHNRIERIYQALHLELQALVPWMAEERTPIYLYQDRESYLKGRFTPPAWSGGMFVHSGAEKALVLFEPLDTAVAAHELTHLYFRSFFGADAGGPPPWLNEGLAAMLQEQALTIPDSRYKGPVILSPLPLDQLLEARPATDAPRGWVGAWYRQAHSVVRFLKRGRGEVGFAEFCMKLRKGGGLGSALASIYGYEDLTEFEAAWKAWRPRAQVGRPVGLESADP